MNRNHRFPLFLLLGLAIGIASCYPGGPEYYSDYDVVITNQYEDYDYSQNKTYFMPDTLVHMVDPEEEDVIDHSKDYIVLNQIRANMANYGYQRVNADTLADVILFGSVMVSSNYNIYYDYGWNYYWGWYPWSPGWGWGGGGYYWPCCGGGWPVVTSYDKGTVIVEMIDPDGDIPDADSNGVGIWLGAANGILSSSTINNTERTKNMLDQMFINSDYLNLNP